MNLQQLWATIAPYLPILVVGLITAAVTFYGPQIVARYPRLGVVVALARRVGLDLSAPQTGRDAYERYASAKSFVSATGSTLPPWSELPERERAAWDASVEALRALRPASTPPPPPSVPPSAGIVLIAFLGLAPVLTGCGASMLSTSSTVANAGAEAAEAAKPVLQERCIEPMQEALAHADVALARATADRCDLPIAAYDLLRRAHVALRAGIVALASGRMPTDPIALIGDVVDASQAMATAIGGLQ